MIFQWSEEMMCGNPIIDFQHRLLCKMLEKIRFDIKMGNSTEAAEEMVQFFKVYFIEHFGDEEAIMKETKYPRKDEHIEEHKRIRGESFKLIELLERSNYSPNRVFETFLYARKWLEIHFSDHDSDLIKYLRVYYDKYQKTKQFK